MDASGYSHRRFIAIFRDETGFAPKRWVQMVRFRDAVERMSGVTSLSELARSAGYSDQAHLSRDFRRFAGLTPGAYRASATSHAFHLLEG